MPRLLLVGKQNGQPIRRLKFHHPTPLLPAHPAPGYLTTPVPLVGAKIRLPYFS
jgi:hypothetical protein